MSKKLYVGNIPWGVDDAILFDLFKSIGGVDKAWIITDKVTGRSRGFGFVIMANEQDADLAMERLNGEVLGDREIIVNEAVERPVLRT